MTDQRIAIHVQRTRYVNPATMDESAREVLAELDTANPVVAASTLRAVADVLDPPRPVQRQDGPQLRRGGVTAYEEGKRVL